LSSSSRPVDPSPRATWSSGGGGGSEAGLGARKGGKLPPTSVTLTGGGGGTIAAAAGTGAGRAGGGGGGWITIRPRLDAAGRVSTTGARYWVARNSASSADSMVFCAGDRVDQNIHSTSADATTATSAVMPGPGPVRGRASFEAASSSNSSWRNSSRVGMAHLSTAARPEAVLVNFCGAKGSMPVGSGFVGRRLKMQVAIWPLRSVHCRLTLSTTMKRFSRR